MKKILIISVLLLNSSVLQGQTIKGRVLDFDMEEEILGAVITLESSGTVTDVDGFFEMIIEPNRTVNIEIKFVGYTIVELRNIHLTKDAQIDLGNIYLTPEYSIDAFVKDKHGNLVCKHFGISKKKKRQYLKELNQKYSLDEKHFKAKNHKGIQIINLAK